MDSKIALRTNRVKREKKTIKIVKLALLIIILLLLALYFIVSIIYNSGNFSISLDENLYFEKGIIIYDNPSYKVYRSELFANAPEHFDNISHKWLPDDINKYDGSHNGENYLAYTFYVENIGDKTSDYWSEIVVDDVIKNVDEVVRIRVYKNDAVPITYAKKARNGNTEKNTVAFESDEIIASDHVENLKPGDKVRYTIVLWLEGGDPECTDNILGGEFQAHMNFNSEFVER